jgi:rhamnose utilization protein RhaD (predicted bifunctional aldolase and dehydrogenase)/NAD(P)-dependent dehydrogenase (short-subunit alcohol dehydrogenase family)
LRNLWSEPDARAYKTELAQRVYTSRLLGTDKSLVLHGGGNTSVKIMEKNIFGEDEEILYVKGSGWDLERIEESGFSPVRCEYLRKLSRLSSLPDPQMVNELVTHLTRSSAPVPSVEAILHAILPYKYVDHTHADAVLAVSNSVGGEQRIREIYGNQVVVIPYVMPGFDLARLCAELFPKQVGPQSIGMVLLNHGLFSFGESAKESYDRMIHLVGLAEEYLASQGAWQIKDAPADPVADDILEIASLRRDVSMAAGRPMVVTRNTDQHCRSFACRPDLEALASQGPATPDHSIRTKRLPMVGRDVNAYKQAYLAYFEMHEPSAKERKSMLDPAPRVVLDPIWGMCAVGGSAKDAFIVADIYQHTIDIIRQATALGGYKALPAQDIFDVEYWDLEQAKLKMGGRPPVFSGEIALVTGAASGIGKACAESLLARGAAVVGVDLNPSISSLWKRPDYLGICCDLTESAVIGRILEQTTNRFGGLDMLVLNAGVFPGGRRIDSLGSDEWRRVMTVNLDVNQALMRECYPLLKLAPRGGRVVVIGSKNVPAPGPGAAAYSASKAALNQLARVAALEWGADNVRINSLHPNSVFDTGLWTEDVLASRAMHYGLSVDDYKKNNVLKIEVTSRDVAELAAEMCGPLFAKTTGAQLPVDGGNDRVI